MLKPGEVNRPTRQGSPLELLRVKTFLPGKLREGGRLTKGNKDKIPKKDNLIAETKAFFFLVGFRGSRELNTPFHTTKLLVFDYAHASCEMAATGVQPGTSEKKWREIQTSSPALAQELPGLQHPHLSSV